MEHDYVAFSVALGIGLAIGLERERSNAGGDEQVPAGLRTFTVASLAGAVAARLPGPLVLPAVLLATGALACLAYHRTSDRDPGMTTELALLCVVLLGALATSEATLAAGAATVVLLLLHGKAWLHHFARQILSEQELRDALVLAAAALVVWPLLPDRYLGPFKAWNPHTLWLIAVLVMLMGAAGHIAVRWLGSQLGLPMAGLFGGFVSSSATIASMAALARKEPDKAQAAVAAALLSTVSTFVQMILLLAATSLATLRQLAIPLAAGLAVIAAFGGLWAWRSTHAEQAPEESPQGRAFDWRVAAGFALMTAFLLWLAAAAQAWLGATALVAVAAVAGFADAHAATASIGAQVAAGRLPVGSAMWPVLAAFSTNTLTKIGLATAAGGYRFALQVGAGLVAAAGATWLGTLAALSLS
ncbi:hypothetical protein BKK79_33390 [Cupriavidus sp. USMAA2-4]|uniref:MgtC/SapB family protein n=1 Tax=unclassified Cupriavidus TaxID=2640874 RepID=UPI0008A6F032|nr:MULTISPECIES: DUF4010 domain-containing protein [unclassified Cupriavidus]AOY96458.1 hypothetical protein BKK79_33390 [Cupriavidus sp. USMAA2-4]AOZ03141.1 hypothetical protein BKK81_28900 [Cupriavidus sp. USMAHM13]